MGTIIKKSITTACYLILSTGIFAQSERPIKRTSTWNSTPSRTINQSRVKPEKNNMPSQDLYTWGRTTLEDGSTYEGFLRNGKPDGKGTMVSDGIKIKCEWESGSIKNGPITLYYPNGDRYEGQIIKGDWGKSAIYTWSNGERYEGEFNGLTICGMGTFFSSNHTYVYGQFEEGKLVKKISDGHWTDNYKKTYYTNLKYKGE